jgi:hypothetical protein
MPTATGLGRCVAVAREGREGCRGAGMNDAAIERFVTAVIVEQRDEWQVTDRRYLSETSARLRQIPAVLPAPSPTRRQLAG